MIKEAKKEKGTDDFLGNIILKLQVYIQYIHNFKLQLYSSKYFSHSHTNLLPGLRISTVQKITGTTWSPEQKHILIEASVT